MASYSEEEILGKLPAFSCYQLKGIFQSEISEVYVPCEVQQRTLKASQQEACSLQKRLLGASYSDSSLYEESSSS